VFADGDVRHDVNPVVYLADVVLRVQDQPVDRLAKRLPRRWKETIGSRLHRRTEDRCAWRRDLTVAF